jgi:hypothetical protein
MLKETPGFGRGLQGKADFSMIQASKRGFARASVVWRIAGK